MTELEMCPYCEQGHMPILANEDGDIDWTKCTMCDCTGIKPEEKQDDRA
jgi:hypothetical protein